MGMHRSAGCRLLLSNALRSRCSLEIDTACLVGGFRTPDQREVSGLNYVELILVQGKMHTFGCSQQ